MNAAAASAHLAALQTSQVRNLSLVGIAAVVVIGLVLAYAVTRIVSRIIVLAVVVVLAFALYSQRAKVIAAADKAATRCEATFFGIHVQPSDPTVKRACAEVAKRQGK
jgi:hypothetical protein